MMFGSMATMGSCHDKIPMTSLWLPWGVVMTTYITSLKMLETVNIIIITISLEHFYAVCVLLSMNYNKILHASMIAMVDLDVFYLWTDNGCHCFSFSCVYL